MALGQSLEGHAASLSFPQKIAVFSEFSKMNIIFLVLIMTFLGYLMAQPLNQPILLGHLFQTLLGTLLLGAGSTSLNQLFEHKIDAKMTRTLNRPLPSSRLGLTEGALFSILALVLGSVVLWDINLIVFGLGLLTVLTYNFGYTLWWKPKWAFAAVPGALPGALPILMGYTAVAPRPFSNEGLFVFLILFFWQMPHFWSLAIRYVDDYKQAAIPTLPVALGVEKTIYHIVLWTLGYIGLVLIGQIFLKSTSLYLLIVVPTGIKLVWELFQYTKDTSNSQWLRFFLWINFSILIFLGAAVVDRWSVFFWDFQLF